MDSPILFHPPEPLTQKNLLSQDMRAQANGLRVEIDCPSLGSSISSFSPLDPPTPATSSAYGQRSLASPNWLDGSYLSGHVYERHIASSPLKSSLRLAEISQDNDVSLPYGMDVSSDQRLPLSGCLTSYDDGTEHFWFPPDMQKSYDNGAAALACHPGMSQYPLLARRHLRSQNAAYLPESATNPCLSRSMFGQPERLSSSASMDNILPWLPPASHMGGPQTIAPSQAFPPVPTTPPSSYSEFPAPMASFESSQTPVTPNRSYSLGTPSGPNTPISRLSGVPVDSQDDLPISPAYGAFPNQIQRQPSRRITRRSPSKQNLTLDSLPSIIKQVQFKCKVPGCRGRFKRQEHLKRHMKSHSREKPHICWVPGCQRAFSRSDNLNAHYTKTHSKRGGRNRYVATLDVNSPDYDPEFRGQLTPDGRPIYGSKLEEPAEHGFSGDIWDD